MLKRKNKYKEPTANELAAQTQWAAEQAEALEGSLEDMVSDLSSWRWLHFYSVPKVTFTL